MKITHTHTHTHTIGNLLNHGVTTHTVRLVYVIMLFFTGVSSVAKLFHPWQTTVRLDSFHFMRRFNCGLTTEHHPLYGIFCAKLSSCIFAWDQEDVQRLKEAKREEWKSSHSGHTPTEEQLMATISPGELKRHCRRRTRGVEETRGMVSGLLESVWELTDTTGLRLVSHDSMRHVWEVQQKHLECLQDPAGVALYTKVGTLQKGGKELDVLRCGRGSSSLESFHKHQCAFIPGTFLFLMFFSVRTENVL